MNACRLYALLFLNLFAGCVETAKRPSDPIFINDCFNLSAPYEEMKQRVAKGDAGAATELAQYFSMLEMDHQKARYWYKQAARLGGKHEREVYESFKQAMAEFEAGQAR